MEGTIQARLRSITSKEDLGVMVVHRSMGEVIISQVTVEITVVVDTVRRLDRRQFHITILLPILSNHHRSLVDIPRLHLRSLAVEDMRLRICLRHPPVEVVIHLDHRRSDSLVQNLIIMVVDLLLQWDSQTLRSPVDLLSMVVMRHHTDPPHLLRSRMRTRTRTLGIRDNTMDIMEEDGEMEFVITRK